MKLIVHFADGESRTFHGVTHLSANSESGGLSFRQGTNGKHSVINEYETFHTYDE